MTGRYQEYPEYRDSGVKWLGDVPISWDVIPLKHLAELKTHGAPFLQAGKKRNFLSYVVSCRWKS